MYYQCFQIDNTNIIRQIFLKYYFFCSDCTCTYRAVLGKNRYVQLPLTNASIFFSLIRNAINSNYVRVPDLYVYVSIPFLRLSRPFLLVKPVLMRRPQLSYRAVKLKPRRCSLSMSVAPVLFRSANVVHSDRKMIVQ